MRHTRNAAGSCAVAALSIVLGAGVALAQAPEQKQQPGPQSAPQAAPPAPKAQQNRPDSPAARPSGPSENRGAENRGRQPQAQGESKRQPDARPQRATEGPQQPKAERNARDRNDGARSGRQQSEGDTRKDRNQNKAAERSSDGDAKQKRDRQAREKASQRDDQQKRKQGDARDRSDRPAGKAAEGKAADGKAATDRTGADRGLRTRLSDEQRRDVRQRFSDIRDRPTVSRVNFSIRVGTRVPRNVRLVAVPSSILAVAPIYRDYRYFVVDERIVIVEPTTYEIVDVIEGRGPVRGTTSAALELTPREREIVRASIPDGIDRVQFRLDLALGADVPARVTLHEFSREIVQDVPKLRGYRFVLVGDDIVIVERDSRDVALVLR